MPDFDDYIEHLRAKGVRKKRAENVPDTVALMRHPAPRERVQATAALSTRASWEQGKSSPNLESFLQYAEDLGFQVFVRKGDVEWRIKPKE